MKTKPRKHGPTGGEQQEGGGGAEQMIGLADEDEPPLPVGVQR